MKNGGKILGRVLTYVCVALAAAVLTAFFLGRPGGSAGGKLEELESLILERFIGEADQTAMEDAAAEAMVAALGDRWSYYIPASQFQAHQAQLNNAYVGIGITVTSPTEEMEDLEILKVTPGGPAEEAGLLAGDRIVAVDGQEAGAQDLFDRIAGEAGTSLRLTVHRAGQELTVTLTRREIQTPVATAAMLEGQVGLVTISNFDSRCAQETIAAIEDLVAQGAKGLIFDVRNNPGGYKNEMVAVLDYLLPQGPLFRSLDYTGREAVDQSDEACLELPMMVLVNGDSYSAAEFFAAALREYEAAQVVGQPTVGKGYFQYTLRLSDGSAVGLSVGKYFTPQGNSLAGVGLTPDLPVEVDRDTAAKIAAGTLDPGEDPQIQAALGALEAEIGAKPPEQP